MADIRNRFPPLYIAAWVVLGVGVIGLCSVFVLQLPPFLFRGLLYISLGLIAFGIGENLNHPKTPLLKLGEDNSPLPPKFHRKRNACALGNLIDIGALLLFFVGLSDLLYPK